MPSVKNIKKVPTWIWVPPISSPNATILLEDSTTGTTYDITDRIVSGEYTDGVTETIGNFNFTIDNSDQYYIGIISLYDKIKVYYDYNATPSTLKFVGLIEKVSNQNENLRVSGRSTGSRVMGITVTYSTTNYTHEILSYILTTYASYITQTNIDTTESTDESITVNWYQKPFWECVLELCNRSGYDCYIDSSFDFNYFVSGSRENTTDAVVHEYNLVETGEFAPDLSTVKNRVIVYGSVVEEQQILWTEEDSSSIASYDVKELIINDSNIITVAQAQARALYELSISKDPPIVGEVTSIGLPTISPGEKVRISDPLNGLNPAFYTIQKFTHKFDNDNPPMTILTVQKEISTIPKILKKRITFETQAIDKTNPNEMRYSWFFDFNTDSGTHVGNKTEIVNGVLKLKSGESTGEWNSEVNALSENVTYCEIRAKGSGPYSLLYSATNTDGTIYQVSTDNGITYQPGGTSSIPLNTKYTLSPPGQNLKIKIVLNSASSLIDSCCLLYKT